MAKSAEKYNEKVGSLQILFFDMKFNTGIQIHQKNTGNTGNTGIEESLPTCKHLNKFITHFIFW